VIASSDVTLALEGHRITAGGPSVAAINVQQIFPAVPERVRILGPGLITNGGENAFAFGVALFFANHSEVSGVTVLGSRAAGIDCFGCNFLTITANTIGRAAGAGISLRDVNFGTISENDASGNADGIFIVNTQGGSTDNTVSHNILNGNTEDGLRIAIGPFFPFGNASVQNNVTNGNGQHGIAVFGGNFVSGMNVEVSNNRSLANGMFDLFDNSPGCTGTVWSGNTFFTSNQSCIH
jgi:parallel beta-helix repeat protein